jgi:hypothetical protein
MLKLKPLGDTCVQANRMDEYIGARTLLTAHERTHSPKTKFLKGATEMSVVDLTNTSHDNADDIHHFVSPRRAYKCFYCGGSLIRVAVLWYGTPGEILLHAACAKDLALMLAKDGFNAGQIELARQVTVGIVPSLRAP